MKKLSMLFAALLLAGSGAMFTGCSDDDNNGGGQGGDVKVTTDPESPITLDGGAVEEYKVDVTVTGTSDWSVAAASGQDWLTADKGSYTSRFYLSATANDTGAERTTTVTITAGGKQFPLTVKQAAPAELQLGSYEDYAGTYALGYQTKDGTEFDIVFTIATSDAMIAIPTDNEGNTYDAKSYTVTGWSYSDIGKIKPMRAVFEPNAQNENVGILMLLAEYYGTLTFDGTSYDDVQTVAVGPADASGNSTVWLAKDGGYFVGMYSAFVDKEHQGLYFEGAQMSETEFAQTISYVYLVGGKSIATFDGKDVFPTDGAVAERGNSTSGLAIKSGMKAERILPIPTYTRYSAQTNVSMLRMK